MRHTEDPIDRKQHRAVGAFLFNYTWSLLDRTGRSAEEDEELLHAAHASRFHWSRVGTTRNTSIGEWQLARVYTVLGRAEPALHHAERCLEITRRGRLGRFYRAYAYEALARASAVARKPRDRERFLREAKRLGASIRDRDDRRMLLEDLATIPGRSRRT